ncbi:MAG: hypothetical protein ACTSRP_18885 [Candidatus Helarchaeota archaeon]
MSDQKNKFGKYLRLILRITVCSLLGVFLNIVFAIVLFLWAITWFGSFAYITSQIFTLIFINLGFFLGSFISGWLSNSLKRGIATSVVIASIIGGIFIYTAGISMGILNIIIIILAGTLGGYVNENNLII